MNNLDQLYSYIAKQGTLAGGLCSGIPCLTQQQQSWAGVHSSDAFWSVDKILIDFV